MMNKLIFPVLFVACLFVTACGDDNNENETIPPFSLEKNYYEVRLERSATSIHITNGSGDISLAIEDENILNATYEGGLLADGLRGFISLHGKQKGNTILTIHDNVTGDEERVEVKVTDCYLAYAIANSNHPVLKEKSVLFLVNNLERDCYIFAKDNLHGRLHEQPMAKGNYSFFVTIDAGTGPSPQLYGIPNLRLTYPSDDDGNLADFNIIATPHDFQIELWGDDATSSNVLSIIQSYLGVDWEKLVGKAQTRSESPIDLTMTLTIPNTEYQITGVLSTASIPEHILD